MNCTTVFLETTIQGDRILGTSARKQIVTQNLKDKSLLSSRTVLGEFVNTFVHDAVVFYNLVVDSPNVHEALKRVPSIRQRVTNRRIAILASVAEESGWNKSDILDRLEQWIEWGLVKRFNDGIAVLVAGTDCKKIEADPLKEGEKFIMPIPGLSCTKEQKRECNIDAFFETNKGDLDKVIRTLKALEKKDKDQNEMLEKGTRIIKKEEEPYGQTCQALKDIIIAMEVPANCCLYTSNVSHFQPICEAIGRELYIESKLIVA